MRLTILLLSLAACGGSSKSASDPADPPAAVEASCCCDYIKEEGDPAGDDWSENQTYELMDAAGCAELSGQCTDGASCSTDAES